MLLFYVLFGSLVKISAHFPGDHIPKEARWCCVNDKELRKCNDLSRVVQSIQSNLSVYMNITCVKTCNVTGCMSQIARNKADLVTLSEESIYKAGKFFSLVPVVSEQTGREVDSSYYAVALILTKASPSLSLKTLKGINTCHPNARDTAGWKVPMGFLIANKQIAWKSCSTFKSAGEFFGKSCVPGALSNKNNPLSENPRSLCSLCAFNECPAGKYERYYGYKGSYRCLVEKKAQVVFVRHTTVFEFTGTLNNLNPGEDFRLLCPDGSRKEFSLLAMLNMADPPVIALVNADVPRDQILQDFWSICHVILYSNGEMITSKGSIYQGYHWSVIHLENSEQGELWDRDVGEYKTCNLARIPASVVMTKDTGKEQFRARGYRLFLLELNKFFKNNPHLFQLFNSTQYGGVDLMFRDSTLNLADVGQKNTTDRWLGRSYKKALDALNSCGADVKTVSKSNNGGNTMTLLLPGHLLTVIIISKLLFIS